MAPKQRSRLNNRHSLMRTIQTSLFLGLAVMASAQFAPPGAQWTYDQEENLYTMSVVGDTVLNGRSCSIIEGSSYSICWQSQAYTYQSGDTVFWSDDQYLPQFFELYRWNAQVGESWDVWSNGPVTVTYTVLATGTTSVNGQALRTLYVDATDTQMQWAQSSGVLIENIGDTLFLFPWLASFCDAMAPWPLRCYRDGALGTFMRPGVIDCGIGVGVDIVEQMSTPIVLVPNLVAANESVHVLGDALPLEIIDACGRTVVPRWRDGRRSFTMDAAGTYILRLIDARGRPLSQSFVVY